MAICCRGLYCNYMYCNTGFQYVLLFIIVICLTGVVPKIMSQVQHQKIALIQSLIAGTYGINGKHRSKSQSDLRREQSCSAVISEPRNGLFKIDV